MKGFKSFLQKENLQEDKWSQNVQTKWTPPENTFVKNTKAEETAKIVCKASDGLKQAVSRVEFFFNRCGSKCEGWGTERAKQIVEILNKICK